MVAREVAVAFLETEDETIRPAGVGQLGDDIADVLETRQATAQLEAVFRSQRIDHGRRHDGRHGHLAGEVLPALDAHAADVVEQQHAHLVAGQKRVVVAVLAGHAHAVGIGVGCQQQVGVHLLAQVDAALHGLANLRVRIRAGGEVPVGLLLLGHHGDVGDARAREHGGHRDQARAVERRIHQLQRRGGNLLIGKVVHRARQHRVVVALKHRVVDPADGARGDGFVEVHGLHAGKRIGFGNGRRNGRRRLGGYLAAVGAVGLVAVVGRGVVARRHADAARAAQIAHGPRKRRHRGDARVHVHGHTVGGQDGGRRLHEQLALVAAVARDCHRRRVEVRVQVVGETLRRTADGVDVHAVRARPDNAAQTGGSEGQILEEGVDHGGIVAGIGCGLHVGKLGGNLGIGGVINPVLQFSTHIAFAHTFAPSSNPSYDADGAKPHRDSAAPRFSAADIVNEVQPARANTTASAQPGGLAVQ